MSSKFVQPYLFFNGRCDEAIEFYRTALGAEVTMLMRFKDAPPQDETTQSEQCAGGQLPPGFENKVMHMSFRVGETTLMASDGMCADPLDFKGFSLSITATSDAEVERIFNALADGGKIEMPLNKTFFAHSFGMVVDRFGMGWMVINPIEMK